MALTDKQRRFVDEYLVDLNATQAAIRAGYSEKTAQEQSSRLLTNVKVQEALQIEREKLEARVEISQEKIMADIEAIKQDAMRATVDQLGNSKMIDHKAALKACELQGKRYGMFEDKLKVSGGLTLNLVSEFPDE